MNILLLIAFFLSKSLNPVHDFNLSLVDITISEDVLEVGMRFEKDDFIFGLLGEATNEAFTPSDKHIQSYINSHTAIQLNQKLYSLLLKKTSFDEEHVFLQFKQISVKEKIRTIDLFNTSLLDTFNDQIHVIQLHQEEVEMRGFQMDKNRIEISIQI